MNTHSAHEDGSLPPSNSAAPDLLLAVPSPLPPGYRLPDGCTDHDLIQRYIAMQMGRTVEACLEIGRGLIALKAGCAHGEFLNRLQQLGINPRVSAFFMAAFRRFSNAASTPLLAAAGKQTKLFELLPLDDDQIEELAVQGQTGPLILSEIPSMTVKAMRETVRKVREERQNAINALLDENNKLLHRELPVNDAALQPGDRIESHLARHPGTVVKVYPDGSACVLWDDGTPQPEGMGHERVPRNLLVKVYTGPIQPKYGVDAAFEHHDSAGLHLDRDVIVNANTQHEASQTDTTNLRRVDEQLKVLFGGLMFDVSKTGVHVGDSMICRPSDNGLFIYVRPTGEAQPEFIAPLVRHNDGPITFLDGQRPNRPGLSVGDRVIHREDGALGYVHSLPGGAAVRVVWDSGTATRPSLCLEEELERTDAPPEAMALGGAAPPLSDTSQPGNNETAETCDIGVVQLNHRRAYLLERMRIVLRHADALEMNAIDDALEALINDVQSSRYVPALVADDYELTRRFWIEGGVK